MRYFVDEDGLELSIIVLGISVFVLMAFVIFFLWQIPFRENLPSGLVNLPVPWTLIPSSQPTPTRTPTSTPTVAISTSTPTLTRAPTSAASRTLTNTATPTAPATLVALPGSNNLYAPIRVESIPSRKYGCGWFGVAGIVWDVNGQDRLGVTVRVWADGWTGTTTRSGRASEYGQSGWEIYLDNHPKEGKWFIQLVDEQGGGLSPIAVVPSAADCSRNLILVYWKRQAP